MVQSVSQSPPGSLTLRSERQPSNGASAGSLQNLPFYLFHERDNPHAEKHDAGEKAPSKTFPELRACSRGDHWWRGYHVFSVFKSGIARQVRRNPFFRRDNRRFVTFCFTEATRALEHCGSIRLFRYLDHYRLQRAATGTTARARPKPHQRGEEREKESERRKKLKPTQYLRRGRFLALQKIID
jgi:hypothetical protein